MVALKVVLKNSDGEDLVDAAGVKMTLGRACIIALDSSLTIDQTEDLPKKLSRGKLIEEIQKSLSEDSDLLMRAEDIAMLKERVGKTFIAASFVRRVCLLLDPAIE